MIMSDELIPEEEMSLKMAARRDDLCKGNLRYEEGTNGEGIWILPCTPHDVELWKDDDSEGRVLLAWLCNNPICPDVKFGSKVTFITNGGHRPYSLGISSSSVEYEEVRKRLSAAPGTYDRPDR